MNIPEELEGVLPSFQFRVPCPWLCKACCSLGHRVGRDPLSLLSTSTRVSAAAALCCGCCCICCCSVSVVTCTLSVPESCSSSGLTHFGLKFIVPHSGIVMLAFLVSAFARLRNAFLNLLVSGASRIARVEGLAL